MLESKSALSKKYITCPLMLTLKEIYIKFTLLKSFEMPLTSP